SGIEADAVVGITCTPPASCQVIVDSRESNLVTAHVPGMLPGQWNVSVRNLTNPQAATSTIVVPGPAISGVSTIPSPAKAGLPFTLILTGSNWGNNPTIGFITPAGTSCQQGCSPNAQAW